MRKVNQKECNPDKKPILAAIVIKFLGPSGSILGQTILSCTDIAGWAAHPWLLWSVTVQASSYELHPEPQKARTICSRFLRTPSFFCTHITRALARVSGWSMATGLPKL